MEIFKWMFKDLAKSIDEQILKGASKNDLELKRILKYFTRAIGHLLELCRRFAIEG